MNPPILGFMWKYLLNINYAIGTNNTSFLKKSLEREMDKSFCSKWDWDSQP